MFASSSFNLTSLLMLEIESSKLIVWGKIEPSISLSIQPTFSQTVYLSGTVLQRWLQRCKDKILVFKEHTIFGNQSVMCGPAALLSPRDLLKMLNLRPTPDLLNPNRHFDKIPKYIAFTLKFEKQWFKSLILNLYIRRTLRKHWFPGPVPHYKLI